MANSSKKVVLVCRRCGDAVEGSLRAGKVVLVTCPICRAIEEKDSKGSTIN